MNAIITENRSTSVEIRVVFVVLASDPGQRVGGDVIYNAKVV